MPMAAILALASSQPIVVLLEHWSVISRINQLASEVVHIQGSHTLLRDAKVDLDCGIKTTEEIKGSMDATSA
jgi:hypothetical protein